jgi:hypothetical protein
MYFQFIDWLPRFLLGHTKFEISWPEDKFAALIDFCIGCIPSVLTLLTILVLLMMVGWMMISSSDNTQYKNNGV